ncbi:hypothetical protein Z043_113192 [Scleropages formosus]|uniref:Serine/threonine-protein phosphatase 2A 55 kDa regulatory subunit B n=1 Tax=Scleropages formosus TaxID=113540 RepID=A0A0P7UEH4_SCLFO|nr:hypothetical protein Z043_113192 [Scleropages formosus]
MYRILPKNHTHMFLLALRLNFPTERGKPCRSSPSAPPLHQPTTQTVTPRSTPGDEIAVSRGCALSRSCAVPFRIIPAGEKTSLPLPHDALSGDSHRPQPCPSNPDSVVNDTLCEMTWKAHWHLTLLPWLLFHGAAGDAVRCVDIHGREVDEEKPGLFWSFWDSSFQGHLFLLGWSTMKMSVGVGATDIISTVEFNQTGELLATGDKGGRVVIFQREPECKNEPYCQGEYNVYSTFQSHEPEFDYLKSLEIEEKINKIRWLPQQNAAHFLLSTNDKTIKLWKVSERDKRPEGYNLKDEEGRLKDVSTVTSLQVPVLKPMDLMVEVSPRRVFANAHTYHVNSISVNSDCETYMSADDLRINLWHLAITDRSFSHGNLLALGPYCVVLRCFVLRILLDLPPSIPDIVDIKPANMEELTEVITAAEFHPHHCHLFVYSSSKGTLRLCDMRAAALCDKHAKRKYRPPLCRAQPAERTRRTLFTVRSLLSTLLHTAYSTFFTDAQDSTAF